MKSPPLKASALVIMLAIAAQAVYAEDAADWISDGQAALAKAKQLQPNANKAKNIILFVGDGMGVSTVTAARIFEGQIRGIDGERNLLSFEKLPYVAMSKTYSANQQTADSAPTMTAIVTGVKTNDGVLSVDQSVKNGDSDNALIQANRLTTILELAEAKGLSTGVVSTARITHATPAATYAHTSTRDWETKTATVPAAGVNDIAAQAIDNFGAGGVGNGIEVLLGGGRTKFLPNTVNDPEDAGRIGERSDGRDLIAEFQSKFGADFVWNKAQFDAFDPASNPKRLLGLFERSHMEFEHDRAADTGKEPSLAEMTSKAIDVLKRNPKGYFLMVEAGRIDHGHHAGNAYRALSDTVALSDAVKKALEKVNLSDTLVIVTADHSHTMTMAGYPVRGNPVLGKVVNPGETAFALAEDGKPYTTISYANGKGHHDGVPGEMVYSLPTAPGRADMTNIDTADPDFHQEALVPAGAETHAAEDVQIFAGGPQAHLFHGVQEQSYIFYVMKDAFGF